MGSPELLLAKKHIYAPSSTGSGAPSPAMPARQAGRRHYTSHLATSRPSTEASRAPKAPPPANRPTRSSPPRRRAADGRTTPRATTARAPLLVRSRAARADTAARTCFTSLNLAPKASSIAHRTASSALSKISRALLRSSKKAARLQTLASLEEVTANRFAADFTSTVLLTFLSTRNSWLGPLHNFACVANFDSKHNTNNQQQH